MSAQRPTRTQDACSLGARLAAVLAWVEALHALPNVRIDGGYMGDLAPWPNLAVAAVLTGIGILLWRGAPGLAERLFPGAGPAADVPTLERQGLAVAGFAVLFAAGSRVTGSLLRFASDHGFDLQEAVRALASSDFVKQAHALTAVEAAAGLLLFLATARPLALGLRSPARAPSPAESAEEP